jgi:integrase
MDRLRAQIRLRHFSLRTEAAYSGWVRHYIEVLGRPIEDVEVGVRAKRPERLPVVLTRGEVRRLLNAMPRGLFSGSRTTLRFGVEAD